MLDLLLIALFAVYLLLGSFVHLLTIYDYLEPKLQDWRVHVQEKRAQAALRTAANPDNPDAH